MSKLLEMNHVSFSFHTYGGVVQSVRDVSFNLDKGEIVGIVGESGCGKSVTAQCILRLNPEPPGFFEPDSSIRYKGEELLAKNEKEMRAIRGKEIGFIFQDPMTSLNPTMKIGKQIEELFLYEKNISKAEKKEKALEMLKTVGISDAGRRYQQYPHELSGGMKQRIMIAMALVRNPEIIIADEPTTSLDVTIEAQILDLLLEMKEKFQVSIILITHDLGVIAKLCDRVLVMYGGKIVERGAAEDIFYRTEHPYTAGLLKSITRLEMDKSKQLSPIEGTPPDLFAPPAGCPFAPRCEYCMDVCWEKFPGEYVMGETHRTCCWLQHEFAPKVSLAVNEENAEGSGV